MEELCPGCNEIRELGTHHWYDLEGNYHEERICTSCNNNLGSYFKSVEGETTHITGLTWMEQLRCLRERSISTGYADYLFTQKLGEMTPTEYTKLKVEEKRLAFRMSDLGFRGLREFGVHLAHLDPTNPLNLKVAETLERHRR